MTLLREAYLCINRLLSDAYQYSAVDEGFLCKSCGKISPVSPTRDGFKPVHGDECKIGLGIQLMRKIEAAQP